MKRVAKTTHAARGFTLIELLIALLLLSMLALMSYRGLGAVLDARDHTSQETGKWRRVASFLARFERDIQLVAPRPVRAGSGIAAGTAPAWRGQPGRPLGSTLEFSRFASSENMDTARRLAYRLNENREIELWLWPALDMASDTVPVRYPVLTGVTQFELQYLNADLVWLGAWPASGLDSSIPQAVQLRIVLVSGEEIVRVFAL